MKRASDPLVLAVLAGAFVAAKLAILDVPGYWDEIRWVGPGFQLADWPLVAVFPGFRPMEAFAGHPPGIFLIFALVAKVAGASIRTAHMLTVVFGAIGVCFTYVLGARVFDRWTASIATLLLFTCPVYFAQSGMFLADVPVAALSTGCVYFLLTKRTAGYLICAVTMVLVKETSAAIVIAMLIYDLLLAGHDRRAKIRAVARHAVPLLALGVFVTWQKLVTGSWWLIYDEPFDTNRFKTSFAQIATQAWIITWWVLVEQWRWLLSAALALALILKAATRRRRELRLFGLIALCASGPFAFAGHLFLPRYLIALLPLLFLAGARAVRDLIESAALRTCVAVSVLAIMVWTLTAPRFAGTAELNMRYLDVVEVHREMAQAIEHDFPAAHVLTVWPHTRELEVPQFGYVQTPIRVADAEKEEKQDPNLGRALADADLVWVTRVPDVPWMEPLRDRTVAANWRLVRRFSRGPVLSELFARPR